VVEILSEMPPGVLGMRVDGKMTRADYTEVIEPALKEAFEAEQVRLYCEIPPGFDGLEPGALAEDLRTAFAYEVGEKRHRFRRTAIATDTEWIRRATEAFAFLAPGEIRVFRLAEGDAARDWAAG
jgi:hypothetical protein